MIGDKSIAQEDTLLNSECATTSSQSLPFASFAICTCNFHYFTKCNRACPMLSQLIIFFKNEVSILGIKPWEKEGQNVLVSFLTNHVNISGPNLWRRLGKRRQYIYGVDSITCPFPFTLPTQATPQSKFGSKSKSLKNIVWHLVDENHHMFFYGTSLNDKQVATNPLSKTIDFHMHIDSTIQCWFQTKS